MLPLAFLLYSGCTRSRESNATQAPAPAQDSLPPQKEAPSPRPDKRAETDSETSANQSPPPLSPALRSLPSLDPDWKPQWGTGEPVSGSFGVVTSVEDAATRAGIEILEAGGNAVDAAVATAFALAVTHPSAGNIGGGGFLLLRLGDSVEGIDFREDSPRALSTEKFWKMIAKGGKGPQSVGVPGTVAGLYLAHERHGRLKWSTVVAPAERLAREGYKLGQRQANTIRWAANDLVKDPVAREVFFTKGTGHRPGTQIKRPRLARTLATIRDEGPRGFYEGATAMDLIESLGPDALLSLEDLRDYKARVREPLAFNFGQFRVITMPAPSAGGVAVAQNLLMLQRLKVSEYGARSTVRHHLIAEASRRSQVERQLFVVSPDQLTEEERQAQRARALDPNTWLSKHPVDPMRATPSKTLHPKFGQALAERENTTHFSVIDSDGGLVSCTVTLSGSYGARLFTKKTGIVLNNSVSSFSSMGINTPAAGKRTTSSMAPTLALLENGDALVLGSPGGDTIPNTVTQTFLALAVDNESLSAAAKRPRFHQPFAPDRLAMERFAPLPTFIQAGLKKRGHEVELSRFTQGDANIAARVGSIAYAVSDKREGGLALSAQPSSKPTASPNAAQPVTSP